MRSCSKKVLVSRRLKGKGCKGVCKSLKKLKARFGNIFHNTKSIPQPPKQVGSRYPQEQPARANPDSHRYTVKYAKNRIK